MVTIYETGRDVVYKPTSAYSEKLNTPISKTNLISGLMLFGKRIAQNITLSSVGAGTVNGTLYTVPVGKTFFLLEINNYSETSNYNVSSLLVNSLDVLHSLVAAVPSVRNQLVTVLPIPMRIDAAEVMQARKVETGGSGGSNTIGIIGYEIDNTLLPTFN